MKKYILILSFIFCQGCANKFELVDVETADIEYGVTTIEGLVEMVGLPSRVEIIENNKKSLIYKYGADRTKVYIILPIPVSKDYVVANVYSKEYLKENNVAFICVVNSQKIVESCMGQ